jgi:ribosomal protein S18 acetylase RimI-like enzyme
VSVEVQPHRVRRIDAAGVLRLYSAEGLWRERTPEQVAAVLESAPAVGAWSDEELVGFARVVWDGSLRAYVEDVIVAPRVRRQRVASRLMTALLAELGDIKVVTLFCDPELTALYERVGFRPTQQVVLHARPAEHAASAGE